MLIRAIVLIAIFVFPLRYNTFTGPLRRLLSWRAPLQIYHYFLFLYILIFYLFQVPPSLLLLSRTLYLPESVDPALKIAAAVSALPDSAATGAKARLGEREGKIENVTRLELIKAEQAKIEEEAKDQAKEIEDKQKKMTDEREKLLKISQVKFFTIVKLFYQNSTQWE